jgi:hypothetical protein
MRGLIMQMQDWGGVVTNAIYQVKTANREACGVVPQLWLVAPTVLHLWRILDRRRLTSSRYSALSMSFCVYVWPSHFLPILAGDSECVGQMAQDMFSRSVGTATLLAWFLYMLVSIITPVAQAYIPYKVAINIVGCTCASYTHVLLGDDGVINLALDQHYRYLLWVLYSVSLAAMVEFLLSLEQSESNMARFLTSPRRVG